MQGEHKPQGQMHQQMLCRNSALFRGSLDPLLLPTAVATTPSLSSVHPARKQKAHYSIEKFLSLCYPTSIPDLSYTILVVFPKAEASKLGVITAF